MKSGASDVEYGSCGNKVQNHEQPRALYGQVENPLDPSRFYQEGVGHDNDGHSINNHHSNYVNSHGSNKSYYGSNMESMHPNNASTDYNPRSNMPTVNYYTGNHPLFPSTGQQPGPLRYDYSSSHQFSYVRRPPPIEGYKVHFASQNVPTSSHYGVPNMNYQGGYGNSVSTMGHLRVSQEFDVQPPLPASPPAENKPLSPHPEHPLLYFLFVLTLQLLFSRLMLQFLSLTPRPPQSSQHGHTTAAAFQEDPQDTLTPFGHYLGAGQTFPSKNKLPDKPKMIDAATFFKPPHRTSRPDHFVIILQGLPEVKSIT